MSIIVADDQRRFNTEDAHRPRGIFRRALDLTRGTTPISIALIEHIDGPPVSDEIGFGRQQKSMQPERFEMTLRPGGARIIAEWGYDNHEIVLTPRNWSQIKRGRKLKIRSRGFYDGQSQWEYWSFAGGLDGDLLVEYGEDGGVGFVGKLHDAMIEEAK